jgi:uncharacterized cupin superfamily protein
VAHHAREPSVHGVADRLGHPRMAAISINQLVNRSLEIVTYLEMGDRTEGDEVEYPNDDLKATQVTNGAWILTHKDGSPYLEE